MTAVEESTQVNGYKDIFNSDGTFSSEKVAMIWEASKNWPPERKAAALTWLKSAVKREDIKKRYTSAAEIAHRVDHDFNITPAISLISNAIETVLARSRANLLVTMPPQEGKSTLCCVYTPIRAWQLNPNRRVIIATYGDDLALQHSSNCRKVIEEHGSDVIDRLTGATVEDKLGLKLSAKSRRMDAWKIDGANGGLVAAGLGSAITGRPADLMIIDDPYKNMQEADSASWRERVDIWMSTVALTRLSPQASVILIQCMTGDTPVLRPDGTETPLRDIRPGDRIATYEKGSLSTSVVRNWTSQGYDSIYAIKTKSGRTVRANARHPFLVLRDGVESWVRLQDLRPGDALMGTANGTGSPAPNALRQSAARGCASRTITKHAGRKGTAVAQLIRTGMRTFDIAMEFHSRITVACSPNREVSAPSARNLRGNTTARPIGRGPYASTTAMTRDESAGCSATTAISPSVEATPPSAFEMPRTMSSDEVLVIEPCGVEEVFDIQVDCTENFIANGLVSHNTRWHKEDLAGKTITGDLSLEEEYRSWRHINIPAISEKGIYDSLGREPGVAMISARGRTKQEFEQTKRKVGDRTWYAMYQGTPRNPEGGLFGTDWFQPRVALDSDLLKHPVCSVVAVDPADSGEGDETGILGGILASDGTYVFTEDRSDLFTSDQWATAAVELALEMGAREIALEGFSTWNTYRNVIKHAWQILQREAGEALALGKDLSGIQLRALNPNMPFTIGKYTESGDAEGRASLLRQHTERKKCRVVEAKLRMYEEQACDWLTGQHCPDRVSAGVILHWRLDQLGSGRMTMASPLHERGSEDNLPDRYKRTIGGRSLPGQFGSRGRYDRPY